MTSPAWRPRTRGRTHRQFTRATANRRRHSLPLAQGQRPARERGRCDSTGGEVSAFRASSPRSGLLRVSTGFQPRGTARPSGERSLPSAHLVHEVDFCVSARGFNPVVQRARGGYSSAAANCLPPVRNSVHAVDVCVSARGINPVVPIWRHKHNEPPLHCEGSLDFILAATYFPGRLPLEYRRRERVSLPCSGWERVGHRRNSHQKPGMLINSLFTTGIDFAGV